MYWRESEEELLQEFPNFYQLQLEKSEQLKRQNQYLQENDEVKERLLFEGGDKTDEKLEEDALKPIRARYDYSYMDGLRGIGAFSVYLQHFTHNFYPLQSIKDRDAGIDVVQPPWWFRYPPFPLFYNGAVWVQVFFVLSGFVLPLNFFKTGRVSCLTGGVQRRYFRLMIPVLMILSIYLLFARLDCFGESTFNKMKNRTFTQLLYAAILETWCGPSARFIDPTWTLGIEYWASLLVYIVAFTGHSYRGRFFFYTALVTFFWTVDYLGFLNLIPWQPAYSVSFAPIFLIGTAIADMENMVHRPLDKIRDLHWGWKIPLNGILVLIILVWGSIERDEREGCLTKYDKRCIVYEYASLFGFFPFRFTKNVVSVSVVILALTSDVFQWILKTTPIQFLGKVSYTLYLIHVLIIHWIERDTYNYFLGEGIPADEAVVYIFLIWTPVLFLISWILELIVDRPSKEFAGEFDRQTRRNRPKPAPVLNKETNELEVPDPKEFYSCSAFSKRIWPIWFFIAWLLVLAVTIEIFNANHTYKPLVPSHEVAGEFEYEATIPHLLT